MPKPSRPPPRVRFERFDGLPTPPAVPPPDMKKSAKKAAQENRDLRSKFSWQVFAAGLLAGAVIGALAREPKILRLQSQLDLMTERFFRASDNCHQSS
ncbi:MAG: hypothetical protein KC501_40970 [Myxococcales bacterium]|nr:hypothetical protein [Myxococcales bacterium]